MYEIYTDGSCRRTRVGGYGFIVVKDAQVTHRFVAKEEDTTNQRMELLALISAYEFCQDNQIINGKIYSDSAYCLNCAFDCWYDKWEKNGFKSTKGNLVKNKDLWERLIPFFKNSPIELVKVTGHSDNHYNNFIDSLVSTISSSRTDDLTNKKFGLLTVKQLYGNKFTEGKNTTFWLCECECGTQKVVSHIDLTCQAVRSCGKCLSESFQDLTGQMFGFLAPIKKIGKDNQNYAVWECKCTNCGGITKVSSRMLKNKQLSCGCIKSKGEAKISSLLSQMEIKFLREYSFKDCFDKSPLKFDFAIFYQDELYCLIEYQGEQHYKIAKSKGSWNNKEHFEKLKLHDRIKRDYCKEKGISLIEIPYTDYDKIDAEYMRRVMNL